MEVKAEQARELAAKNAARDRAEIKVQEVENGFLVKIWTHWFVYPTWAEASEAIDNEFKKRRAERT